jgi:hypothetical protein
MQDATPVSAQKGEEAGMTPTMRALQGQYRPAVRAAWDRHCDVSEDDPKDRGAYEAWYRRTLRELAGIETTAGATPAQMQTLIEALRDQVEACPPETWRKRADEIPRVPEFSERQQRVFAALVQAAWGKVQATSPSTDFHAWFELRMRDATLGSPGFSGGNLFDRAMCLFGVIAGDEFWILRTAEARERRLRFVIRGKLEELGHLRQCELDWSYVQGICDQAKLASSIDDCPAEHLHSILAMLDTQVRREQ